jgi:hypothetical protein
VIKVVQVFEALNFRLEHSKDSLSLVDNTTQDLRSTDPQENGWGHKKSPPVFFAYNPVFYMVGVLATSCQPSLKPERTGPLRRGFVLSESPAKAGVQLSYLWRFMAHSFRNLSGLVLAGGYNKAQNPATLKVFFRPSGKCGVW